MSKDYYIDLKKYSLDKYAQELEKMELIPSRRILREETKARFALLTKEGIKSLDDVLNAGKKKEDLQNLSQTTKIPEDFLATLVREIKSLHPKPVKFSEIQALDLNNIKKLTDLNIKTTKALFPFITTKTEREDFAKKTGINSEDVLELTKLTDVSRIKYVGANFARVLVDSNYNTTQKVSQADPQKLLNEINAINAAKEYYKGKLGVNDMKICVEVARAVPEAIEY